MQVVIREGRAIAAVPPDYRLLDYDTENREYFYAKMRSEQAPPTLPRPISQGSSSRSQASKGTTSVFEESEGNVRARARLVRGLSAVLASEAVSSPPMHGPFPACKAPQTTVRVLHLCFGVSVNESLPGGRAIVAIAKTTCPCRASTVCVLSKLQALRRRSPTGMASVRALEKQVQQAAGKPVQHRMVV